MGLSSSVTRALLLQGVFDAAHGVLHLALALIHLALGLHFGIAGHVTGSFLGFAAHVGGCALDTIFIHGSLQGEQTPAGVRRMNSLTVRLVPVTLRHIIGPTECKT